MISPSDLAYVEPTSAPTAAILDDLTRKATSLLRLSTPSPDRYRGVHDCTGVGCLAHSTNHDFILADGRKTTSLLVHYVACHRDAVPASDLAFIAAHSERAEPTESELMSARRTA